MTALPAAKLDPKMPDADLARAVAGGSPEAMRLLMRRYNQTLFRTARAILRDDAEAEDAVQEAYMSAYRSIGRFRAESKLSTWLVRIAVNESLARLRKTRRSAHIISMEGDERVQYAVAQAEMSQSSPDHPETEALRAETRRLLETKIDALPDAFRTVFVLRAVEEMSVDEVAAALDIPEATVRTRFFRARGLLRESLAREADLATETAFSFAGARCDRIVETVMARIAALSQLS
jgi:RNA polymerase sigma-70 factor (ECF subfamily)